MTDKIEPDMDAITELATMLYNFPTSIRSIKANIQSFLLGNQYVKLAKDQSLPSPFGAGEYGNLYNAYLITQQKMSYAGWRKVELEVINEVP